MELREVYQRLVKIETASVQMGEEIRKLQQSQQQLHKKLGELLDSITDALVKL